MIRHELKRLLAEATLILEQEGDEAEETADADAEDTPEETEGEDAEAAEEEDAVESDETEYSLGKTVEDELNALFVGYEEKAIQSAKDQGEKQLSVTVEEGRRPRMVTMLFENESIDLENFAQNISRLTKNYDSLMDMERMILTKASDFIRQYYGEEQTQALEDILDMRYGLTLDEDDPIIAPIAVGAFGDGSGGA